MNMIIRDHFLSNFFSNFENNQRYDSSYEVYENESSFDIHIELPGLKREQLSVQVHENHLKVNTRSSNINKKDETSNKRIKKYSKTFKLPKNIYSTDMSIFVYFNSQRILLDRRLIVSEDEDFSESNPSPLNYYDLAIQNDYSLAEVIVEQIALGMLSN